MSGLKQTYNWYEWTLVDVTTIQTFTNWSYSVQRTGITYGQSSLNNINMTLTQYERIGYVIFYLIPNYQMTDSSGSTCSFRNPHIYDTMPANYTYYASTTSASYYYTFYQEQLAPYTFSLKMADGTALSTPSGLITVVSYLNSYYLNDPSSSNTIYWYLYPQYHPVFYDLSITYHLNFVVSLLIYFSYIIFIFV